MAKSRNSRMSERQYHMLELKAQGWSYTEIGEHFGITGSGARNNIRDAGRLLQRHGEQAFPDGIASKYSIDALLASIPNFKPIPSPAQNVFKSVDNGKGAVKSVSVATPFGEIFVSVKTDPDYPGVYIDLKGPDVNATFEDNTVGLAMVEFDPLKNKIQTVVYGDGNSEEPTHVIEHEHVFVRDIPEITQSDQVPAVSGQQLVPPGKTIEDFLEEGTCFDVILIERDYKGIYERYALTPQEFHKEFASKLQDGMSSPSYGGDSYTLSPLVHMWYQTAILGGKRWTRFFTDMSEGLPERDIESGNLAYIRHDFMRSLASCLPTDRDLTSELNSFHVEHSNLRHELEGAIEFEPDAEPLVSKWFDIRECQIDAAENGIYLEDALLSKLYDENMAMRMEVSHPAAEKPGLDSLIKSAESKHGVFKNSSDMSRQSER